MEMMEIILTALFACIAAIGLVLLVGAQSTAWLAGAGPLSSKKLLGRIPPTRKNGTIMGAWYLIIGTYFVLSVAGLKPWYFIAAGAMLALLPVVIHITLDARRQ